MQGKKVRDSSILTAQVMNPQDANPAGNVHGGVIMKLIDTAAGAAAVKHSRANCVTASIDRLDFHHPVFIGDLVTLRAGITYTGKSSMEVGVRVEAENLLTGKTRHTVSAYMTWRRPRSSGAIARHRRAGKRGSGRRQRRKPASAAPRAATKHPQCFPLL
jgi:uncharacterized protein (TIGR00369 family)